MNNRIPTPTVGEILLEDFMKPAGISSNKLAKCLQVPSSRVNDLLHNRRKITPDTSLRLARFFGVSDRYFLNIQNDIDMRELKQSMAEVINNIQPFRTAVM
ncbi:MAG: HigA family addiction module antidote protein [Lachnospiraceae bacterium]|nr:HigA family addiction module antidote protein [Lachnospiraceae bacterium]